MRSRAYAASDAAPASRPAARPGMFRALRVRNYRLYAGGQLVSLTGTWMQRVAQDWLVLELTNSGTALGVVTQDLYSRAVSETGIASAGAGRAAAQQVQPTLAGV